MENNKKLYGKQLLNGSYEITEYGLELIEKIEIGTKVTLSDKTEKTITDFYKNLPHVFYFKCDNIKNASYGIENIISIVTKS